MPQSMDDAGSGEADPGEAGPGEAWALFLDFDGTLVEIAERPEAIVVDPGLGPLLTRLRDRLGGALAIVSGRPIAAIDGFLSPHAFDVAGLHGAEHRIGGVARPCLADDHPAIRRAVARLRDWFGAEEGVQVEDKAGSVALHWRRAPGRAEEAMAFMEALAAESGAGYRLQRGKAVAELLPAGATKGAIIEDVLGRPPFRGRTPIFVGDDLTDEHAFEAVNRQGGVSVRVGPGPTSAKVRVASPAALRDALRGWAASGRCPFDEGASAGARP